MRGSSPLSRYGVTITLCGVALLPRLIGGAQGAPSSLLLFLGVATFLSWRSGTASELAAAIVGFISVLGFLLLALRTNTTVAALVVVAFASLALTLAAIKTLSARLRRSERTVSQKRALVNALRTHLHEGVCILDRAGLVSSMNPAAEQMLGWRSAELAGQDFRHILHDGQTGSVRPVDVIPGWHAALMAGEPVQILDALFSRKDGSSFPVAYTITPIIVDAHLTDLMITFRDMTDRKRLDTHRMGENFFRTLVDFSPDSMIVSDLLGFVTMANQRAAELHGYDGPDQMIGMRVLALLTEDSQLQAIKDKQRTLEDRIVRDAEYLCIRRDGTSFPVEVNTSVITDETADPQALLITERDITRHKEAARMLRESKEHVSIQHAIAVILAQSDTLGEIVPKLLETICERGKWDMGTFWSMDPESSLLRCYDTWSVSTGRGADFDRVSRELPCAPGVDLPGRVWSKRQALWILDIVLEAGFRRALMASNAGLHTAFCFPIISGGTLHGMIELFSNEIRPVDRDLMDAMIAVGSSIGQFMKRRQAEKALEHQALHDALTDLPNRVLFQARLERALSVARSQRSHLAVLLLDLDRFKEVNDTFGHQYGDLLLQQAAMRLEGAVRDSDTVARLGGDEFAVLLPATDRASAVSATSHVLQCLQRPFMIEKQRLDVGASVGVALHPTHGEDAATLLQHADIAMYVAKRARSGFAVYAAQEDVHSPSRFALSVALRQAIEKGSLVLHYQPKIDSRTGEVDSVEALVRWQHPDRGLLAPAEFIPLAEEAGLIKPLTRWVLAEALRQAAWWHNAGVDLRVAVNISTQMLHDRELVSMITDLLTSTGADPAHLAIEITESALFADSARAHETLLRLHEMGVRISIDDFGTGYSSLTYLRRLTVDEIKIDRSFVVDMLENNDDVFITQAVIDLGHNLGLDVVAEGIEDGDTWDKLAAMGCDQVQGFYLSRPVPAAELTAWLRSTVYVDERVGSARSASHLRALRRSGA